MVGLVLSMSIKEKWKSFILVWEFCSFEACEFREIGGDFGAVGL